MALLLLVMGVVYVGRGRMMPYHERFLDMTGEEIANFSPNLATLLLIAMRLLGTLFISAGILLTAVIYYGLRKAERWAWWTTLIGMAVIYAPVVAITKPVGGFPWTSAIVMLIVFIIAIGLAAREVFKKVPERSATT